MEAVDRTRPNAEKLNRLLTKFEKFEHKLSSIDNKVTQSIAGNEILQKEIADVKEELRLLKKYCKKNPSANPETTKTLASKSVLPDLPLKNLEDLLAMDKLLSSSQEERHNLIEILKGLGGIHIRSVVHNMMRTCLTKEVSVQFSLKGKTNKRNFSELNIYECIKGMCHEFHNTSCYNLINKVVYELYSVNKIQNIFYSI